LSELTPLRRGLILCVWLAWMGLVFYFSTKSWGGQETRSELEQILTIYLPSVREQLSRSDLNTLNFVIRKMAHFTEYAILTTLGYFAWSKSLNQPLFAALRNTLICSIVFAISDEFHQLFEAGRTSLATDVLIDSLGASMAVLILQRWVMRSPLST
jgi:VanZ family protein